MPTTAPHDPALLDQLTAIPPIAWLFAAALLAGLVRWVQLRIAIGNNEAELAVRNQMTEYFITLRRTHALTQDVIDTVRASAANAGIALRNFDATQVDPRLLILHDDAPRRPLAAFPRLAHGRLVLFMTGRIVLVSESAFEKLIEADDALREKLRDAPSAETQDEES